MTVTSPPCLPPDRHQGYWGMRRLFLASMLFILIGTAFFSHASSALAASSISEFHVSNVGVSQGITTGLDGNLWFTYKSWTTGLAAIGRMTTSGVITLTAIPTTSSLPTDITAGPDGNLWFTEGNGSIGRITVN